MEFLNNLKKKISINNSIVSYKLYLGIIIIFASLGIFSYLQIDNLLNRNVLQTNIAGIYVDGIGNISYKFDISANRTTLDLSELNTAMKFEVKLPDGIRNYFNEGESPIISHSLRMLSPTLQTYNFVYEKNISLEPFDTYSLSITDFIDDFNFMAQNPGLWKFSFSPTDKNGNPIGPELFKTINIRSYPISLIVNKISNGLRVFWETSDYAIREIENNEVASSAFTKELQIHFITGEVARNTINAESFPISSAGNLLLDPSDYKKGYIDLAFNTLESHAVVVTLDTTSSDGKKNLYYSTLKLYPEQMPIIPNNSENIQENEGESELIRSIKEALGTTNTTQTPIETPNTSTTTNTTATPTPINNQENITPQQPVIQNQEPVQNNPPAPTQTVSNPNKGDINKNGQIDIEDYIIISNYINVDGNYSTFIILIQSLGINLNLSQIEFLNIADLNNDGEVNTGDLNLLYLQNFR